ncbi:MAG: UTP--glucose-1-phosphate uridylyltransferase GalU [Sutterella sp.]|nr:UTP--glucose-1-phosphate uridylyltransferase GalU [Sutterella sp.]
MKPVKKVVFPVNGLGTRFLPATKAMPKEMLPIIDRPLIQYAVDEAVKAGVTEMIFVTGRTKRAIEDHFDNYPELERELEMKGKKELLDLVQGIVPPGIKCIYIRQPKALGLGHAVLCAKPVVGDEPFGVILADDLVDSEEPCIGQLIKTREEMGGGSVLAVLDVAPEETKNYGIVSVDDDKLRTSAMRGIVEKPDPSVAPSRLAVIGRYVFEPEIFDYLEGTQPGVGGEIQLTDGVCASLETVPTYAHRFEGKRFDCGSKQGFLDATINYARKRGFVIH